MWLVRYQRQRNAQHKLSSDLGGISSEFSAETLRKLQFPGQHQPYSQMIADSIGSNAASTVPTLSQQSR